MSKTWTTKNMVWTITEYESSIIDHRRGWLINNKSGNKYVWNVSKSGKVSYMKQPSIPTNIPKYIDLELINGNNQTEDDRGTKENKDQSMPTSQENGSEQISNI